MTNADPEDLITWYRQQLDADEQAAREPLDPDWVARHNAEHFGRHLPVHVLADIAAKRAILDMACMDDFGGPFIARVQLNGEHPCDETCSGSILAAVISRLASAYAHRPGYRTEWTP